MYEDLDVALIGPYPPPVGGVSVHVARLADRLQNIGLTVGVLDHFDNSRALLVVTTLRRNPFRYWAEMRRIRARIVHLQWAGRPELLLGAAMAARRRVGGRWLLTIHSHDLERSPRAADGILGWALHSFDQVIVVSGEIAAALNSRWPGLDMRIVPAYLPPLLSELTAPPSWSPEEFVLQSEGCLVLSAYGVFPWPGNGDLYGIDHGIDILSTLKEKMPDLRLAIFLSKGPHHTRGRRYLNHQLARAAAMGLERRVKVFVGAELLPALAYPSSIYLRPTSSDGDAVGIREALDLGVPVIASDVTRRPTGTRVLPLSATERWADAVEESVPSRIAVPPAFRADSWVALMELYKPHLPIRLSSPANKPDTIDSLR